MTCVCLRCLVFLCSRLVQAFISLEKEIEDELPLFQEIIVNLRFVLPSSSGSHPLIPFGGAANRRDLLPKRRPRGNVCSKPSRNMMPSPNGYESCHVPPGARRIASKRPSSYARPTSCRNICFHSRFVRSPAMTVSILTSPVCKQSLPKPKKAGSSSATSPAPAEDQIIDPDSEVARVLQPLLEQEALLETFVEEAKAHRKFEDVKTLKNNLREIRAEIERILANAEEQASTMKAPSKARTS